MVWIQVEATYGYSEAGRHPVKVIGMLAHGHDFRHDGIVGPLYTKHFSELLQVLRGGLADREDGVAKPAHAKAAELLIEELDAEL